MEKLISSQPWFIIALTAIASYIIVAYAIALMVYIFLYIVFRKQVYKRKIQSDYTSPAIIRHEISYSFFTLLIHSLAGAFVIFAYHHGYTLVYPEISDFGYWYFAISILLMIIMHDTYFYWTHRFMHLPKIYPKVHRVHHVSLNPSPWAAYSGHPYEAAIAAGIFPIIALTLPSHWIALSIFLLYMLYMSVMGHAGFEFYPKSFIRSWLGRWQTTATHHNLHHKFFSGNYGIYFNIWDKIMNTEQKHYHREYDRVFERQENA